MTYRDIKDAALMLMFSYSVGGEPNDTAKGAAADYIRAMAPPTNAALRDLASVCPIQRRLVVKQYDAVKADSKVEQGDVITITAEGARAFYCELDGGGTAHFEAIQTDGSIVRLQSLALDNRFMAPVRYLFSERVHARVVLEGNVRVQNHAFYDERFDIDADIPSPGEAQTYSIAELIKSQSELPFYKFDLRPIRCGEKDISAYVKYDGRDSLTIPSGIKGEIHVHYLAYPTPITKDTPDSFEIELPNEAADLVPYYIASVLYAEDDMALAREYRNEYYAKRASIAKQAEFLAADEFQSYTGW